MTREEAIKRFETLLLHVDTDCVMGMETTEAINMAIKALEQPESCEDMVPRTSVKYICNKNTVSTNPYEHKYHDKFIQFMDDPEISDFGRWQHSNGFNTALVAVKCDLDKVPSVQPKGRWEAEEDYDGDTIWRCSECGTLFVLIDGTPMDNDYNYCPHCGARLEYKA